MSSNNVDVKATITAEDKASKVISDFGNNVQRSSAEASDAFGGVSNAIGDLLKKGALLLAAGSFGIGAAAKASWDQVSAVQQATVALNAYEKDTTKVNAALNSLVAYAQSDLGVLFNRKDLFASAQSLEVMGDNIADLSAHVQILSRSVGLGLSTWDELDQIVGRIGSTGRLTGIDFDNLTKAGFRLDSSLRNTDITYQQLFAALDKGIPVDALSGQANTIQGISIRLQTAFRGIGNAILGVDASTNQFTKGGLGDTLVNLLRQLTDLLKTPAIREGFALLGKQLASFATAALPLLVDGLTWLLNNIPTVEAVITSLAVAFIFAKGASIAFAIAATANPYILLATAITAIVGALTYLQIKFDYVTKAVAIMQPSIDLVSEALQRLMAHFQGVSNTVEGINWGEEAVKGIRNALIALNAAIVATPNFIRQVRDALQDLWSRFTNLTPVIILAQYFQQVFWPAVKAVAAALYENLLPALQQLGEALGRLLDALNPALTIALKIVAEILVGLLLVSIWAIISAVNLFVQAWAIAISMLANVINWISNLIAWFGNLVGVVVNVVSTILTIFSNLNQGTRDMIGGIVSLFSALGGMILGAIGNFGKLLYQKGRDLIGGLIDGIQDKIGDVGGAISGVGSKIGDSVKGALSKLHVPGFAEGGFTGNGGIGDVAGVVHKGEYVLPQSAVDQSTGMPKINLGGGGGGNTTINISVNAGAYMGNQNEARKYAMLIMQSLQDIASQKNTTVGNMIGASA
jgi:phage-related protein